MHQDSNILTFCLKSDQLQEHFMGELSKENARIPFFKAEPLLDHQKSKDECLEDHLYVLLLSL